MFFVTLWPNALIKAPWNLSLTARVNLRGGGHTLESSLRALEPELLPFTLFRPEPIRQGPEHRLPSFNCCLHLKPPRLLWIVFFFYFHSIPHRISANKLSKCLSKSPKLPCSLLSFLSHVWQNKCKPHNKRYTENIQLVVHKPYLGSFSSNAAITWVAIITL